MGHGGRRSTPGTPGAIEIGGELYDGDGEPSRTAWSRPGRPTPTPPTTDDPRGFGRPGFEVARRAVVGSTTLVPGAVPGPDGTTQAPHIDVSVFARGLLHRTVTRIYFAERGRATGADPRARHGPRAAPAYPRRQPVDGGYRFDIRLQGEGETVFFDI